MILILDAWSWDNQGGTGVFSFLVVFLVLRSDSLLKLNKGI